MEYKNRYNDVFTFTEDDHQNILWEGNFQYCRIGMPNDYTDAYKAYLEDREGVENILSLEEFKNDVHEYQEGQYLYPEYIKLVKSMKDEIDMVDPSGGCYLAAGMSLDFIGFKDYIIEKFEPIPTGYKIIIKK